MTEFKVMAGDLMLGITSEYAEALYWAQTHDQTRVHGPRARIVTIGGCAQ